MRHSAKRPECRPLKGTRVFLMEPSPHLRAGLAAAVAEATGDGEMRAVVESPGFEKRETWGTRQILKRRDRRGWGERREEQVPFDFAQGRLSLRSG